MVLATLMRFSKLRVSEYRRQTRFQSVEREQFRRSQNCGFPNFGIASFPRGKALVGGVLSLVRFFRAERNERTLLFRFLGARK